MLFLDFYCLLPTAYCLLPTAYCLPPLPPRLIARSPSRDWCAGHAAAGTDFDTVGNVRLVNRLAGGRLGGRCRIPVLIEDVTVRPSTVNDMSAPIVIEFTAAGIASGTAAQIAAEPGEDIATAAIVGAIAVATEDAGDAAQAIRLAVCSALPAKAAALVARIAAIRRIANPLAPIDVAATLAAGGLTMQPPLHAAIATADRLAARPTFKVIAFGHPLFIRPAKQRALPAAARSATTAAHILATAAASQERGSTNPNRPPGNHREVL